jgi:hypothetical protein
VSQNTRIGAEIIKDFVKVLERGQLAAVFHINGLPNIEHA